MLMLSQLKSFGKCTYELFDGELDDKIDTTLMCVYTSMQQQRVAG